MKHTFLMILLFYIGCASTIQSPQSEVFFLEKRTGDDKFSLGINSSVGLNVQKDIDEETQNE